MPTPSAPVSLPAVLMLRRLFVPLLFAGCASGNSGSAPGRTPSIPEAAPAAVSAPVAMKKARAAARDDDLPTAVTWARRAVESDPNTEEGYLLWASCCEQLGDLDCAAEAYSEGLEANPGSATLLRESGLFALQTGDVVEAVRRLEASLSRDPSPETKSDLAFAYLFQDRADDADALTAEVVAEAPDCFICWMARAEVSTRLSRHDEAVEAYRRAVGLAPQDVDAKAGLAKAMFRAGAPEKALPLFEELVEADPDDVRARVQAAQAASAAGRPERAVEHLKVVAEQRPDDPAVLDALAEAQRAAGDEQGARRTEERRSALEDG